MINLIIINNDIKLLNYFFKFIKINSSIGQLSLKFFILSLKYFLLVFFNKSEAGILPVLSKVLSGLSSFNLKQILFNLLKMFNVATNCSNLFSFSK